jgi:hypothetical protein
MTIFLSRDVTLLNCSLLLEYLECFPTFNASFAAASIDSVIETKFFSWVVGEEVPEEEEEATESLNRKWIGNHI